MTRSRVNAHSPVISRAEFYERSALLSDLSPCLSPFAPSARCIFTLSLFHLVPMCISRIVPTFHPAALLCRKLNFANDFGPESRIVVAATTLYEQSLPHRCIVIVPVVKMAGLSAGPIVRLLVRLIAIILERGDSPCSFFFLRRARENVLHEGPNRTHDVVVFSLWFLYRSKILYDEIMEW